MTADSHVIVPRVHSSALEWDPDRPWEPRRVALPTPADPESHSVSSAFL
jgi:hypothetical protein